MGPNRKTFLNQFPTLGTFLCGISGIHSDHLMTSSCSLFFKDIEERAPRGIENALGQMVVLDHVGDLEVFYRNMLVVLSIAFRSLEMVIAALALDLQMHLGDHAGGFSTAVTALLTAAQLALLAPEGLLGRSVETGVLNGIALAIG